MNTKSIICLLSCWALPCFASSVTEADDPQIAANGSGNLVAFWEEYNTTHFAVHAASYLTAGGGWQPSTELSTDARDALDPEAVMNAAGDILAVWSQNLNGYYAIYATTGVLGSSWGTPVSLSTSDSSFAQVGIDAEGQGVALWQEKNGTSTFHIATSSFTPGSGWSSATALSDSSKVLMMPKAVSNPDGRTVAVWQIPSVPGPLYKLAIQAAFYSAASGWSVPVTLSNTEHGSVSPRVGTSATGEALVVWATEGEDNGTDRIAIATLSPEGDWGSPVFLSDPSFDSSLPHLAMNATGQAMVVWASKESDAAVLRAISRSAEGVWGSTVAVAPSGVSNPEVAINSSGKAVAIWVEGRPSDELIHAAIYSSGSWGSPVTISAEGVYGSCPEVRVNEDGSAAVVWQSQNGDAISILSARLGTDNSWSAPGVIN